MVQRDERGDARVVGGIVRSTGRVSELIDAENAQAVAGRVSGVGEVIDDVEVAALER